MSGLSLAPALSQTTPMSRPPGVADVGSTEKGGQELYGCFSPRVGDSSSSLSASSPVLSTTEGESVVVLQAPVLQAMPELRELCLSPTSPLSVEHLEVDSSTTSCEGHVSPLSSKQLKVHESIMSADPTVDDAVSMVPLVEDVDAAGVLMLAPRSLLVDDIDTKKFEEFYDFLDKWVADQPQSSKTKWLPLKGEAKQGESKEEQK